MLTFQEGFVPTNGIHIHYYRSTPPGDAPTLVLLHGVTDNGLCWARVARALNADYDLILVDARGHGKSDAPESGYSAEDRAADVAGLIEALKLDRPVLVGHSQGAETAIAAAGIYPASLRAVVLEDPPWPGRYWGSTPEERAERAAEWRADILKQRGMSHAELVALGRKNNSTWNDEELELWANAKLEASPYLVGFVGAPRRRWTDYLRQAQCPILLITGDPQRGAIVNPRTIEEAKLYWKQGRVAHIPGAGHSIHREQLDAYLDALKPFLTEVFQR